MVSAAQRVALGRSVLSARATLLGLVKVNVVQHFRILPTVASGLRAQHSSCQPKVKWDGQKASSCEQPVDVARAGDGAPLASTSCRKTTLEPGRPSQPTLFSARSSLSCRSIGLRDETSYFCRDLSILLEPVRTACAEQYTGQPWAPTRHNLASLLPLLPTRPGICPALTQEARQTVARAHTCMLCGRRSPHRLVGWAYC
jgi:hypothetical protein